MLLLLDLLLTILALFLADVARHSIKLGKSLGAKYPYLPLGVYGITLVIWTFVSLSQRLYFSPRCDSLGEQIKGLFVAIGTALLALAGALYLSYRTAPRLLFVYFFLLDTLFLLAFRLILWLVLFEPGGLAYKRRFLILGAGKVGQDFVRTARHKGETRDVEIVGFLDDDPQKQGTEIEGVPVLGPLREVVNQTEALKVTDVLFALPLRAHKEIMGLTLELQRLPVRVGVIPDLFELAFVRTNVHDFAGIPVIGLKESALDEFECLIKRSFDLIVASLLLIMTAPVMACIAIAIRLDSPSPIIFRQQRVGENGRLFWMYKFRSMVEEAEQRLNEVITETPDGDQAFHKTPDDPRITRVGRWLRHTSLDELPQLFNVLKGEMSLVGPRPELPFLVKGYEPWQLQRFAVPPGITGWWQVNGRGNGMMHMHTEYDLYYIQNYSLWLDLKILWRTIGAAISGKGAY